jgi:hypothetical protein
MQEKPFPAVTQIPSQTPTVCLKQLPRNHSSPPEPATQRCSRELKSKPKITESLFFFRISDSETETHLRDRYKDSTMAWFRSLVRVSGIKPRNRALNPFPLASLACLSTEATTNEYSGLGPTVPQEKPRVVVVGSGWAACRLMKGLDTNLYDVVCVSPRNHMVFTPLLASTCVGTLEFRSVAEPISRIQPAISREPGSYFFLSNCTGIDPDNHSVC